MKRILFGFLGAFVYDVVSVALLAAGAYFVFRAPSVQHWFNGMAEIAKALQ